ncbi:hypothetical protein ACP275_13G163600 [Erythranthe tilingii]
MEFDRTKSYLYYCSNCSLFVGFKFNLIFNRNPSPDPKFTFLPCLVVSLYILVFSIRNHTCLYIYIYKINNILPHLCYNFFIFYFVFNVHHMPVKFLSPFFVFFPAEIGRAIFYLI